MTDTGDSSSESYGKEKELRQKLQQLETEKSTYVAERKSLGGQLSPLLQKAKQLRDERNAFTQSVRKEKQEREKLHTELKKHSSVLKELSSVKQEDRKGPSPGFLKQQIEKLELKVETEVLSFDKETALMKQIRKMKKEYAALAESQKNFQSIRTEAKEASTLRKQANTVHAKMQDDAKKSQSKHEELITLSKQIDEMNSKVSELDKKIADFNLQIRKIMHEIKPVAEQKQKVKKEFHEKSQQETKVNLAERRKIIYENLKKGEKLTTEDLIILQSEDDSK